MKVLIRSRISSQLDVLDSLHAISPWIPGRDQIRPSEKILNHKLYRMEIIMNDWETMSDYILGTVFLKPSVISPINRKFMIPNKNIDGAIRFVPNEFPYSIPEGNHWVLWLGPKQSGESYSDLEINSEISIRLEDYTGDPNIFDFAWYENPKMTIPGMDSDCIPSIPLIYI
jgi:hypothetical protein